MPETELIIGPPGQIGDKGYPGLDGVRALPGKIFLSTRNLHAVV